MIATGYRYIVQRAGVRSGHAIVEGTRIGVHDVVAMVKTGASVDEVVVAFALFGAHDWAARIPIALCTVLLCWVTARFGAWAFGRRAGLHAGLVLGTSVGLFLFT